MEQVRRIALKAAVFDIDGTLLPAGRAALSDRVCRALAALQKKGVPVIIATGRAPFAARKALGKARPDYLVSCTGCLVQDKNGETLEAARMTEEEMYALVDFCEDYELPLDFVFEDGYYVYVEYARMMAAPHTPGVEHFLKDGEDQVRHLQGMPYAACVYAPEDRVRQFRQKYGHLGLRFLPFAHGRDKFDAVRADADKAAAVGRLLERLGLSWAETAAFGDGENDAQLLAAAGVPVAMADGWEPLKTQGRFVAPPCAEDGAAQWLEKYVL